MKRIRTLLLLAICCATTLGLRAQQTVTGRVTDPNNEPLIGASVLIPGTGSGTVTNFDGDFEITVPSLTDTLLVTYVGYETLREPINGRSEVLFLLREGALDLNAVTVTALGIEREAKALGYAVQEIDGEQLDRVKDPNLINNLAGKLAGVRVTGGGSGIGSSSRIVIRGESSLSGDNQPLFVVNGVPINNDNGNNGGGNGNMAADYGNSAADINPDDIETVTVLKGANATALYGSRAANGVILITTKSGAGKRGIGASFSSNTTFERPLRIPEYQNSYGQGAGGQFAFGDGFGAGTNDNIDESWGPAFAGSPLIVQHNSPTSSGLRAGDFAVRPRTEDGQFADEATALPWTAAPGNIGDFFETGYTTINTVALYGGDEQRNFRLSYSNTANEGILPNTDLSRNNLTLDVGQNFLDQKLRVRANANYINSSSDNRPNNSYGTENVMYLWVWFGRQIEMNSLRDYWQPGQENIQQFNYNYNWHDNPYFTMYENTNAFDENRLLGNVNATYDFTDELQLMVRYGLDTYDELRTGRRAWSTQRFPRGQYREDNIFFQERNADFLLTYAPQIGETFTATISAGGNQMTQERRFRRTSANELAVPGVYSFNNAAIPLVNNQYNSRRRINSLYATANLGFRNFLYLDLSARNDWSSTLPAANNSYFYPSASLSAVLSEVIDFPAAVSFAKLRAGYGQVGADTDPYRLLGYFQFSSNTYGGQLLGTEDNLLANANLKPERLNTLEFGADLRFLRGRLGLDLTWYNNVSRDQILQVPVSQASGYGARYFNAGEIESKGVELLLTGEPVSRGNFDWRVNLNFTRARSTVNELAPGIESYQLSSNYLTVLARPGERMGDVYGTGFVLIDTETNERVTVDDVADIKDTYAHLYDANGFPVRDPNLRRLGNYNPDFQLGLNNDFRIGNIDFGFLWDWSQGGVIMSRTLLIGGTSGMMAETAEYDRETTDFIGGTTRVTGVSELDRNGVVATADGTYVPNTTALSARDFYWSHFNRDNETVGMYDATFLKLREARIGYNLPREWVSGIGAQRIRLSLIGRNLLLFTENPHFDPEVFSYGGGGIVPGVEDMATPSSRSFGFNLNVVF
ncbi:SusC/RagA family TonB-linked outer membrane protein [Lewinella sp. IMCC34191]|uniref:SusC/RagA family TonB-linked outer membrane protein n=1 Tax=Lewinella sp. IMCC34191 TaxID=2259172 RepID=UPI000E24162B|nr:SusC/RagA family TonB-linked outer membrane protein [Lewinella sp. IMCC34191]